MISLQSLLTHPIYPPSYTPYDHHVQFRPNFTEDNTVPCPHLVFWSHVPDILYVLLAFVSSIANQNGRGPRTCVIRTKEKRTIHNLITYGCTDVSLEILNSSELIFVAPNTKSVDPKKYVGHGFLIHEEDDPHNHIEKKRNKVRRTDKVYAGIMSLYSKTLLFPNKETKTTYCL